MNADGRLDVSEAIFLSVFFVLVFVVLALVVWATYSQAKRLEKFDLSDLWTHNNRIDKFAVIILGSWWLHSCSIIMWTLLRTIQTQDYLTYQAWAIPIMVKMFAPSNPPPEIPKG